MEPCQKLLHSPVLVIIVAAQIFQWLVGLDSIMCFGPLFLPFIGFRYHAAFLASFLGGAIRAGVDRTEASYLDDLRDLGTCCEATIFFFMTLVMNLASLPLICALNAWSMILIDLELFEAKEEIKPMRIRGAFTQPSRKEKAKSQERDREAAWIAIAIIKGTVNFDDGFQAERELMSILGAPQQILGKAFDGKEEKKAELWEKQLQEEKVKSQQKKDREAA
ncbi:hypothetical protein KY289_009583 [Solanum tuberosum]|nr:hypothetical protein KY289_009583 [Solanum tuberosum]